MPNNVFHQPWCSRKTGMHSSGKIGQLNKYYLYHLIFSYLIKEHLSEKLWACTFECSLSYNISTSHLDSGGLQNCCLVKVSYLTHPFALSNFCLGKTRLPSMLLMNHSHESFFPHSDWWLIECQFYCFRKLIRQAADWQIKK